MPSQEAEHDAACRLSELLEVAVPAPSTMYSSAPEMRSASSGAFAVGLSRSSLPWMTSVGRRWSAAGPRHRGPHWPGSAAVLHRPEWAWPSGPAGRPQSPDVATTQAEEYRMCMSAANRSSGVDVGLCTNPVTAWFPTACCSRSICVSTGRSPGGGCSPGNDRSRASRSLDSLFSLTLESASRPI